MHPKFQKADSASHRKAMSIVIAAALIGSLIFFLKNTVIHFLTGFFLTLPNWYHAWSFFLQSLRFSEHCCSLVSLLIYGLWEIESSIFADIRWRGKKLFVTHRSLKDDRPRHEGTFIKFWQDFLDWLLLHCVLVGFHDGFRYREVTSKSIDLTNPLYRKPLK